MDFWSEHEIEGELGVISFRREWSIEAGEYGTDADGRRGERRIAVKDYKVCDVYLDDIKLEALEPAKQNAIWDEIRAWEGENPVEYE